MTSRAALNSGERQVSPTVAGIRRDHIARYEWAAGAIPASSRVLDLACGIGYGTRILAADGHWALGGDISPEAIKYAGQHYSHERARFQVMDATSVGTFDDYDAAVCFETIEHVADPKPLLRALHCAPLLLASVPNEYIFPFAGHRFHFRHYTQIEFHALLIECGWKVTGWFGQLGPESEVEPNVMGRTLLATAVAA